MSKVMLKLKSLNGYVDWEKRPKLPVLVEVDTNDRKEHGWIIPADEMARIGYRYPTTRFFPNRCFEVVLPLADQLQINNEPATPLNKIRTPKRRNPQAVRRVSQLENGIFRVNGLFNGKARVCHVHLSPDHARVVPINPCLISKTLTHEQMQNCLDSERISVMCMERF